MTYEKVLRSLEELVSIHQELIEISQKKTEHIKVGKVDELQDEILHERKLSLKLEQAEEKRQAVVEAWFSANDIQSDEMTIASHKLFTASLSDKSGKIFCAQPAVGIDITDHGISSFIVYLLNSAKASALALFALAIFSESISFNKSGFVA